MSSAGLLPSLGRRRKRIGTLKTAMAAYPSRDQRRAWWLD